MVHAMEPLLHLQQEEQQTIPIHGAEAWEAVPPNQEYVLGLIRSRSLMQMDVQLRQAQQLINLQH